MPTVVCQPPSRMFRDSTGTFRAAARISAQVCSAAGAAMYPVEQTTTPLRRAAATSIAALRCPVLTSSLSAGSRSRTSAGNRVRSRIATTTSKSRRRPTTSAGSANGFVNTSISAPREPQSPKPSATSW